MGIKNVSFNMALIHLVTLVKWKIVNNHFQRTPALIFLIYILTNLCALEHAAYIFVTLFLNRIFHFENRIMFIWYSRYRFCGSEAYKIGRFSLIKCFKILNINICTGP